MAAVSTIIAGAALATASVTTVKSIQAQKSAKKEARAAAEVQKQAQLEQKAGQAQQAAAERRMQVREERMRRARIAQSSASTGVAGSSGALGAAGGLSSQFASNLGFNLGAQASASRLSDFGQQAADHLTAAQSKMNTANQFGQIAGLSTSIFGAAGGFNSLFPTEKK